jgi:16S rRNA (guanine1207-N2)-methyltransferase
MLEEYAPLNKVDSARRCGLYHGRLEKQPTFDPQHTGANTSWII